MNISKYIICNISVTMQHGTTHVTAKPYIGWADAIVCAPACMLHASMNRDISLWSAALVPVTDLQPGSL